MSATEELRRLLDERGVEWGTNETLTDCWTRWEADKFRCTATEINGIFAFSVGNSTPEQAIAATLGAGTCHDVYPNATYCFTCSECGHVRRFIQGWNNVTDRSQDEFNFCPNCGAKVVK